ncbi:hypothetical protein MKJ04_20590 [Pontibacter sp. E15-1]|uniref:hypothetical protein n=1 Tax=Pontibacter sp. E15-1 TaxID=2919918 RepID=UPI001F4F5C61|nr:hypothetical protein [Pontibacter sp. E15-1]MCJ8167251.1 hypothetical protein [Pontibacter sp. E15-1]
MPKNKETRIEDFAFDFLRSHYTTHMGARKILTGQAERTKQGHLVDGLFSFENPDKSLFIASLSTRNSADIATLLNSYKSDGLGKLRFGTAAFLLVSSLWVGIQAINLSVFYALPLALVIAFAGLVLHSFLLKIRLQKKIEVLLDDLKNAPADEQWLGISVSSLTFRRNELAQHLLHVCQRRRIGVITVGKRAKVVLLQEPQTQNCRRGDFLSHYESEVRIRKALLGDSYLRVA